MHDTLSLQEYATYWIERIGETRQLRPEQYDEYVERLVDDRVIDAEHRAQFRRIFQSKPLDHATPRPGLEALVSWSLEEAERLDSDGAFTATVRDRANEMLAALQEPLLSP